VGGGIVRGGGRGRKRGIRPRRTNTEIQNNYHKGTEGIEEEWRGIQVRKGIVRTGRLEEEEEPLDLQERVDD